MLKAGRRCLLGLAMVLGTGLAGCAFTGVDLVQDHSVTIIAPADQASVTLPLRVSWTGTLARGQTFAVFVDEPTLRPGQTLRSLAQHDPACLATPGCPGPSWLSGHGIYLARGHSLTLTYLANLATVPGSRNEQTLTIIKLAHGRRVGEGAWYRQFYVAPGRPR
jgi:hypothetical protein